MKQLLSITAFLISVISFGSHLNGGQIYWTALGNNYYNVHIELVYDYTGAIPSTNQTVAISNGNSVVCALDTTFADLPNAMCSSGNSSYGIYRYTADSVLINPSSSVLTLTHTVCCRPVMVNVVGQPSHYIESRLFPAGRNVSSPHLNYHLIQEQYPFRANFFSTSHGGGTVDMSLFAPLTSSSTTPVSYSSQHSANHPVASNDNFTSKGQFSVPGVVPTGNYVFGVQATHRNAVGAIMSEIGLDIILTVMANPGATNDPPTGDLINLSGLNYTWFPDSSGIEITANKGDVISLGYQSFDDDFTQSFTPQQITARSYGLKGTPGNPTFTPVAPQSSNASSLTNNMNFDWALPTNIKAGNYQFVLEMVDNSCNVPGKAASIISVIIQPDTIDIDTFHICQGGSIQLAAPISGSTYSWSPANSLSSATTANTTASPSATTTYSVEVDGDIVAYYTVDVSNPVAPIVQQPQPNEIELTNPGSFNSHAFLYYYVPFAFNDTIVTVSLPGDYHVVGQNGGCFNLSSLISVGTGNTWKTSIVNTPLTADETLAFDDQSSYEMELSIGTSVESYHVSKIVLPGVSVSSGAVVQLEVMDDSGNLQTITGQVQPYAVIFEPSTDLVFTQGNGSIKLTITGGPIDLPIQANIGFPYTYNQVNVSQSTLINNSVASPGYLVPFAFEGFSALGVEEVNASELKVYPQPAIDILRIENVEENTAYQIIEMNGRIVSEGNIDNDQIDVSELNAGAYILKLNSASEVQTIRIIIQ